MKTFLISLGLCLVGVASGMDAMQRVMESRQKLRSAAPAGFGEATMKQFAETWHKFKPATPEDAPDYLTASGIGEVSMTLLPKEDGQCWHRFIPYVKGDDGDWVLFENPIKILCAFDHKQAFRAGRMICYGQHEEHYFYLIDRPVFTFFVKESECMPLSDALSGLRTQLEKMKDITNIIPKRKEIIYTDPDEIVPSDTPTKEGYFSSDAPYNRAVGEVEKIGAVPPFDEGLGRLRSKLSEIAQSMLAVISTARGLR